MGFMLQANESASESTHRILTEQVDKAINDLNTPGNDLDDGIHQARKSIKRTRAVLRLVRDDISSKAYRRANTTFRDLARNLSTARDSKVLLDTLTALVKDHPELDQAACDAIKQHLQAEYEARAGQLDGQSDIITQATDGLNTAKERIAAMSFNHKGFKMFAGGLRRTYSRGRMELWTTYKNPNAGALHEWRKSVKYLWHQVEVLSPTWETLLVPYAEELHILSDYLGDDHDYAVLKQKLYELPAETTDGATIYHLSNIIDGERLRLEKASFQLGKRLYAEETAPFVERLGTYYRAWSREAEPATVTQ